MRLERGLSIDARNLSLSIGGTCKVSLIPVLSMSIPNLPPFTEHLLIRWWRTCEYHLWQTDEVDRIWSKSTEHAHRFVCFSAARSDGVEHTVRIASEPCGYCPVLVRSVVADRYRDAQSSRWKYLGRKLDYCDAHGSAPKSRVGSVDCTNEVEPRGVLFVLAVPGRGKGVEGGVRTVVVIPLTERPGRLCGGRARGPIGARA